ncbi:MAG TPA: glycosyltransferase family 2 protein [Acidimicrobiales bacterium]|nr:glycosyltransferase family 2 protein [Acidimicrobiales bacterium]
MICAVVVNFNAAPLLPACVASLRANGVAEIVVVDNASVDGSQAALTASGVDALWVQAGANLGYGRAANLGAGRVPGADLLVCNPDLELGAGALDALAGRLEKDPSLGLVGPRLENPDGSLYPSARTFPDLIDAIGHGLVGTVAPDNRFTRRYRLLDWDHAAATEVDWVSGACFLAHRPAWDAVGGFDPSYFMYLEDVDLCWRMRREGWKIGYEPAAVVTHVQGVSTNQRPYRMLAAHHVSMWRFARRTTRGGRRAVLPLVGLGLVGRLAVVWGRRVVSGLRLSRLRGAGPGRGRRPLP